MSLVDVLRRVARLVGPLARPLAGRRWLPLWMILEHRWRRSGRLYRTPLAVRPTDDGFVIPVPFGDGTQWPRNLQAAGGGTIRWKGGEHLVTDPEIVDFDTVESAFNPVQRAIIRAFGVGRFVRVRRVVSS